MQGGLRGAAPRHKLPLVVHRGAGKPDKPMTGHKAFDSVMSLLGLAVLGIMAYGWVLELAAN